ncbi:hypothetical protein FHS72_000824 [Loktanella ponticola]|uniref:Dynamin N-terminal domain-containing protein n=1 Tax=Yoonia ponticola TaxID=1524255 RepID=A0A7W9BJ70_9RHOB|nr:dynamin family protein [Yoonia ponticola]MBB5721217.1 hypothetical protein [Yoonia ponticola]
MTHSTSLNRKPRIALMGEFSAGKSTLSNLLLGSRPLPEKVTATRLSPVWMAAGSQPPYRVDIDGTEELISLAHLEEIGVENTRVIRLFFESDILDVCDLIDFPGISDPNMSTDVVDRMLDEVDAVLWCTHATQAWRQSEAALWAQMPEAVRKRSILLITRFDKLTTERDRNRVLARVKHETKGQFGATFPVALLRALNAGEDYDAWEESGAAAFTEHLIEMVQELTLAVAGTTESLYVSGDNIAEPVDEAEPTALLLTDPVVAGRDPEAEAVVPRRVSPRRVSAADGTGHTSRPSASRSVFGSDDLDSGAKSQIAS